MNAHAIILSVARVNSSGKAGAGPREVSRPPARNNLVNGSVIPGGASAWTTCCQLRSRPPLSLSRGLTGLSWSIPDNLVNGSVSYSGASAWTTCRRIRSRPPLSLSSGLTGCSLVATKSSVGRVPSPDEASARLRGEGTPPTNNNLVNGGESRDGASAWTACHRLRSRPPLSLTRGEAGLSQPVPDNLVYGSVSCDGVSAWTARRRLRSRPPLSLQRGVAGLGQPTPVNLVNGSVSPVVRMRGLRAAGFPPVHQYLCDGARAA